MLILLLTYLLLGGSGPAKIGHFYLTQAKSFIGDEVKDPARKKSARESAKAVQAGIKDFLKQSAKDTKAFRKLYEDYDSTPAQFDDLVAATLARQDQTVSGIIAGRQTMLQSITEPEWAAIMAGAQAEDTAAAKKAAEKAAKKAAKS